MSRHLRSLTLALALSAATLPAFAGGDLNNALGGGLGGVAGAAVGGALGGSTGSVIGGAVGGGAGGALTSNRRERTGAIIGGALGDMKRVTIRAEHFATDGLPLFTEPDRSQKGLVRDLRLELVDFELAGLRVERLSASIPNCRFDYALAVSKRQIRLSKSGVGVGTVVLRDKDLEAFILRKFKEIKRVSVRIEDGRAVVETPPYRKLGRRVIYSMTDLEAFVVALPRR